LKQTVECGRRFKAFGERRDERDAHEAAARIDAVGFAGEETARQHDDIIVGDQSAGEVGIRSGSASWPTGRSSHPASTCRARSATIGVTASNFSRYWRRLSMTCASSFHAATLAAWIAGLIALPW
jgi:hypothetical protein